MQYADCLYAKSCRVADRYDESTVNDIFMEEVEYSICYSLQEHLVMHPHVDETNIGFKTQSLLAI